MASAEVRQAYRDLYKALLHTVRYSQPGRTRLRDHLRTSFRSNPPDAYSPTHIAGTLEFLKYARHETGLEHKIVKNMVHTLHGYRESLIQVSKCRLGGIAPDGDSDLLKRREDALKSFWETLDMLGKSMGMAVR